MLPIDVPALVKRLGFAYTNVLASILRHCKSSADVENSLRQIKKNQPQFLHRFVRRGDK